MANELTSVVAPSLGDRSLRIQPTGWTAPDGSYVLCFGADREDWVIDTWPAFRLGINGVYPTGFTGGETLQIAVGLGSTQTINFQAADQTLAQVIDRINATLTDAVASEVDGELKIESDARGLEASLQIVGGTGMAQLGHIAATGKGYGGLKVGDYLGFQATIDLTSINLLTFYTKMRQPINTGIKFKLAVLLDGQEQFALEPAAGSEVDAIARTVNASLLTGSLSVEFRIEAVPE